MATYTIPLRKETMKVPKYKRAKKALASVREFTAKHAKVPASAVRIGAYLNLKLWERGIKNPAHHVKVDIEKEKDIARVELFGAPKEEKKPEAAKQDKKKAPETGDGKTLESAAAEAAGEEKKEPKEAKEQAAPAVAAEKNEKGQASAKARSPKPKKPQPEAQQ